MILQCGMISVVVPVEQYVRPTNANQLYITESIYRMAA